MKDTVSLKEIKELKKIREEKGLTGAEVGKFLGRSSSWLSSIEKGIEKGSYLLSREKFLEIKEIIENQVPKYVSPEEIEYLKKVREGAGYLQIELAELLGQPSPMLSRKETGRTRTTQEEYHEIKKALIKLCIYSNKKSPEVVNFLSKEVGENFKDKVMVYNSNLLTFKGIEFLQREYYAAFKPFRREVPLSLIYIPLRRIFSGKAKLKEATDRDFEDSEE